MPSSSKDIAIGHRLEYAMDQSGLTCPVLATLVGVSDRTVHAWVLGERGMPLREAIEVAEFCNTSVAYLAGEENFHEPVRAFMAQVPFRLPGA